MSKRAPPKKITKDPDENADSDFRLGPFPLTSVDHLSNNAEQEPQVVHNPNPSHLAQQLMDTPTSEHNDPSYYPPCNT
jgi:hypothetical protein